MLTLSHGRPRVAAAKGYQGTGMGVGTYREDYGGAGRSINVDGPLTSDEDYEAYKKEQEDDGEHVLSQDEYNQDQYDGFNERLLETVVSVARDVGLSSDLESRFGNRCASFDKDLTAVASGGPFAIGWRSWEHDFVVAIGPSSSFEDFVDSPEANAGWAITECGRPAAALADDYRAVLDDFESLVRVTLLSEGMDTSVPTGSYTSSTDKLPDDYETRIETLTRSVKEGFWRLSRDASQAMSEATVDERLALAKAIVGYDAGDVDPGDLPKVLVAVHDEGGGIGLWDPRDEENGLHASMSVGSPEFASYLASLPHDADGLAPIPFCAETEAWYAKEVRTDPHKGLQVALSAEQYAGIAGGTCTVTWNDDVTGETGTYELVADPAASPRP